MVDHPDPQAIPWTPEVDPSTTAMRVMDKTMVDWLLNMEIRNQPLRATHGWISRFYGQQHQMWEGHDEPEGDKNKQRQTLPLPLLSVMQTTTEMDPDRWVNSFVTQMGYNKPFNEAKLWDGNNATVQESPYNGDGSAVTFTGQVLSSLPVTAGTLELRFTIGGTEYTEYDNDTGGFSNTQGFLTTATIDYNDGALELVFATGYPPDASTTIDVGYYPLSNWNQFYGFRWPTPININYQIDIYSKTAQDMQRIRSAILSRFDYFPGETYLKADFPFYGTKLLPLNFKSDEDTAELGTQERERILRRSMYFTLKGWIFKRPVLTKTINKAHVVFIDGDPDESGMDWYCNMDHYTFSSDGSRILSIDENPSITPPNKVLLWLSMEDLALNEVGTNVT
jgi:hypothetical protein